MKFDIPDNVMKRKDINTTCKMVYGIKRTHCLLGGASIARHLGLATPTVDLDLQVLNRKHLL